jgi:hypothetical protein
VYQSRGRLTGQGYEIEMAIPFKTLRFPPARTQSWALNIVRRVQSTGHEDSWAPAEPHVERHRQSRLLAGRG